MLVVDGRSVIQSLLLTCLVVCIFGNRTLWCEMLLTGLRRRSRIADAYVRGGDFQEVFCPAAPTVRLPVASGHALSTTRANINANMQDVLHAKASGAIRRSHLN